MHVFIQIQSFRRKAKKLKSLFSRNKQRSKDIKHLTTASEIKSCQGHLVQKHKPQEMITQYACNKPASWSLNIRLSAAKTRFTQSKFRMLHVLHYVVLVTFAREKKRKENHCSSRLSRSRFTLSRTYESCLACQRLFLPVAPSRECFFTFVKGRIPGGTCVDSPFNGFFHFWHDQ